MEKQEILCHRRLFRCRKFGAPVRDDCLEHPSYASWIIILDCPLIANSHCARWFRPAYCVLASEHSGNLPQGTPTHSTRCSPTSKHSEQLIMATLVTYSLTITSVKLSLLFLYRSIFNTPAFKAWTSSHRSNLCGMAHCCNFCGRFPMHAL